MPSATCPFFILSCRSFLLACASEKSESKRIVKILLSPKSQISRRRLHFNHRLDELPNLLGDKIIFQAIIKINPVKITYFDRFDPELVCPIASNLDCHFGVRQS